MPSLNVDTLVEALRLEPHPEGGWYREVHRAAKTLELPRGPRAACTAVHYVLPGDSFSALHRVASDEIWSWYDGAPLELSLLDAGGRYTRHVLGRDPAAGETPLAVVPAGCWQGARPVGDGAAWCGCFVAPGFDFADFELAERAELLAAHPAHAELILQLTRA